MDVPLMLEHRGVLMTPVTSGCWQADGLLPQHGEILNQGTVTALNTRKMFMSGETRSLCCK